MEMSDFEPRGDLYNENVFPAIVRPNFGQPEIISPLNFKFELTENKVSDTEFMRRGVLPEYIDYAFMGLIACNRRIRVDEIFNELDKNLYLYPLSERIVNGRALRMEPIHIKTKELYPIRILRIDDPDYNGHPQEYLKTEDVFGKRDRYFFVKFTIKVPSSIFLKKEPESSTKFDEDNLEGADSLLKKFILCDIVYDLKPKCPFSIDLCDRNYSKYFKNETELMDCQNKESAGQIQDKEKEQENTQGKEQENAKGKEQEKEKGGSGGQETEEQELKYINYHSIVLTLRDKEEINDLNLFVATDLHVSERNDEMFPIIFKGLQKDGKRKEQLEKYYKNKEKFEKYFMNNYNPDDPDYDVVKSINDRLKSPYIFAYKIEPPYIKPFNNTTVATEKNIDFEDDDFFWNLPIEYRIQNPNNNLRMFIYEANEAYKKNQLDLVIFLGDLVDYVSPKDADDFEYENSNWKLFQDILLGKAYKKKIPGCLPPEEILVPIYTIPGNHDYRGHIYPVTYKNKIFGLTNKEVKYYSDVSILSSFKAIYANIKFLRGYFQFINPDLNYAKKIGKTHLIFLDTDKDSFIDFYDLMKGSPSTKGLHNEQVQWLKNYCNRYIRDDENILIFSHAPPINIPKLSILKDMLMKLYPELKEDPTSIMENNRSGQDQGQVSSVVVEKILKYKRKMSIDLLKEYALIEKFDDPRIDPLVDLKFGTILRNWEWFLKFLIDIEKPGIAKPVNILFCGHTHKNLEYRLEHLRGRTISKIKYLEYWPFNKVDIPCAVYLGNYANEYESETRFLKLMDKEEQMKRFKNKELIINRFPFILNTTSLGPRSMRDQSKVQAYRRVIIRHNFIEDFRLKPLIRYFIPYNEFIKN